MIIQKAGGSPIYFNDPDIRKENKDVEYSSGHHNHIHVCFHPQNDGVKDACDHGIQ